MIFPLLLLFSLPLLAQKNTWITVEGGLATSRFQYADNSSKWKAGYSGSAFYGVYLRKELNTMFSLEFGYGFLEYGDDYGLSKDFYLYDGGNQAHQVPFRIYAEKSVLRDRFTVFASLGYTLNVESTNWGNSIVKSWNNKGDTLAVESTVFPDSRINSMIGGSTGVRFRLFDLLTLNLALGYNHGFADLRKATIHYRDIYGELKTTYALTSHQYWFVALNLSYPLNRARDLVQDFLN